MALLEFEAFGVDIAPVSALGNLSFRLAKGQIIGIAGAADSGKTTLAFAVAGLLPPEAQVSGRIIFDGQPLPKDDATMARIRSNRIGFVFDENLAALDPLLPIGRQAPIAALTEVGIDAAKHGALPADLTTGERRLVAIAQALQNNPDIIVADDPARGLDPIGARAVLDQLAAVARQRRIGLLLLVRDPRALAATCHEIMILRGGRIVETGTPGEVYARPQNEHTRDLIAAGKFRTRTLQRPALGEPLLSVSNLAAGPLSEIDFEVRRGEAVAIIGASRSGKTTLARIVAGLERVQRGGLVIEHDPYRGSDLPFHRRREIAMVFADPAASFDPALTLGASLIEPLRLEPQLIPNEQAARLMEVVRAVGVDPVLLTERPGKQPLPVMIRLALARALIGHPRLLVLDDFGEGLDVQQKSELLALFARLRSDYGLTVLMLTRDIEAARAIADRALILHDGGIVEEGKPADLMDSPKERPTQALVRARLPEIGALPPGAVPG